MNKKFAIIGAVLVLLLLGGGGYVVMSQKGPTPTPTPEAGQMVEELDPSDIGLKLELSSDKKKLKVIVGNVSDIQSLDYEVTYEADIPASEQVEGGEGETRTTRGFSADAQIKSSDSKYESKYFDLGSCSKNVCRYDTGVEEIEVLMKVTKKDGKIYQVEESIKI